VNKKRHQAARSVGARGLLLLLLACVMMTTSAFDIAIPGRGYKIVTFNIASGKLQPGDEVIMAYKVNSSVAIVCPRNNSKSNASVDVHECTLSNQENSPRTFKYIDFFIKNGNMTWQPEHTVNESTATITHAAGQQWGRPAKPVAKVVVTEVAELSPPVANTLNVSLELWDEDGAKVDGRPYIYLNGISTHISTSSTSFDPSQGVVEGNALLTAVTDGEATFKMTNSSWYNKPVGSRMWEVSWGSSLKPRYGFGLSDDALELSDILKEEMADLPITYSGIDTASSITGDLRFGTTGKFGSTFDWTSDDTTVVDIVDGTDPTFQIGKVSRPAAGSMDKTTYVNAIVKKGEHERYVPWQTLIVKPLISSLSDANLATGLTPAEGASTEPLATDGDLDTYWEDTNGDNTFTIDFGGERTMTKWVIHHLSDQSNLSEYKFQISADGASWTDQDIVTNNTEIETSREFAAPITARYVRLVIVDGIGLPAKIREFEVWGVQPNHAPKANNVSISGFAKTGATLTGSYEYADVENDPEGTSTFQWYAADDAAGTNKTAIAGATDKTNVLTEAQEGKYITFAVKPIATAGTATGAVTESSPVGPAGASNIAPTASDVSIGGTARAGATLTGSYAYSDAEDDAEGASIFQWYVADDAAGTNKTPISGANGKTVALKKEHEGKFITFGVTPIAATGIATGIAVESAAVGPVGALKGDANGDGQVTPADVLLVNKYIQGKIQLTAEELLALDMDDDGDVDADDAKIMLDLYLGKGA